MNAELQQAFVTVLIQLGDDHLILGHRMSEWCGHAPSLEEDLSMPNIALDLIGQASALYSHAAAIEDVGRTEDDIAYLRSDREYHNCLLVERPNTDFAHTMLRHFYFALFMQQFWHACETTALTQRDETLSGIAAKAVKECRYHVRHTGEWIIRLGDGTERSAGYMQDALDALHAYTAELFTVTSAMQSCIDGGLVPDPRTLQQAWQLGVDSVFAQAKVTPPTVTYPQTGGREGMHGESFGFLLAELQYMQRAYPGAHW